MDNQKKQNEVLVVHDIPGFISTIIDGVKSALKDTHPKENQVQETYLSRNEAAGLLGISLPSLNEWTKDGTLKSYKLSDKTRRFYKRSEIDTALIEVKN